MKINNPSTSSFNDKEHDGSELLAKLCPFGYRDILAAETALLEAGVLFNDFVTYVYDFADDTETSFIDLDIAGLAYEYILQEARSEIESHTAHDICNETDIYTYFNYMCSGYDRYSGVKDIAEKIPESKRSQLFQWFIDQLE